MQGILRRVGSILALVAAGAALAHEGGAHEGVQAAMVYEQQPWGIAGDARQVRRTITVRMSDSMRFIPDRIRVRQGETVRFILRNEGRMLHEMVLGTKTVLDEHAKLMRRFPDMEHDAPWMAHVAPGGRGEIVWRFNWPGEFYYACLIPGHYEAGMVGRITVIP
ncbi:MAG: cupredoxin family protein [Burkholderiales bacterium]|nr:cupredoxin family protein [Burkholderiales bacterium]